jgi:hypothetical protein
MKRIVLLLAVAACVLAASTASAQSDLGMKGLGAAIGFVSPENGDGTFTIGVLADHGTLAPQIGLESHIDYWGNSDSSFGVEAKLSDIAVGARGKYYFPVANPSLRPFAGAGLALHFIHAEVTVPAQFGFPAMTAEDSSTKLGLDLGGGLATDLSPRTDFLAEMWFGIVEDVSTFSLRAGLCYKLGS